MNDKQELIREVADAALIELQKLQQRHVKVSSPVEIVKELFKGIRDPQPAAETIIPVSPLPVSSFAMGFEERLFLASSRTKTRPRCDGASNQVMDEKQLDRFRDSTGRENCGRKSNKICGRRRKRNCSIARETRGTPWPGRTQPEFLK